MKLIWYRLIFKALVIHDLLFRIVVAEEMQVVMVKSPNPENSLKSGERQEYIFDDGVQCALELQESGNLIVEIYDPIRDRWMIRWESGSAQKRPEPHYYLHLQDIGGNLVIYEAKANSGTRETAIWAAHVGGKNVDELHITNACYLDLQNDAGIDVWSTRYWTLNPTSKPTPRPTTLKPSPYPTKSPTKGPTSIPSKYPSPQPTIYPTIYPTGKPSVFPSLLPSQTPSMFPSSVPTETPTASPTGKPSVFPSLLPSQTPSMFPSSVPTETPTASPTLSKMPSSYPSSAPTFPCNISPFERRSQVFDLIQQQDVSSLHDMTTDGAPQYKAVEWLVEEDEFEICPDDVNILQRYSLAVFYFSTSGENWSTCYQNDGLCGGQRPFKNKNLKSFLSYENECQWAGITCNSGMAVTGVTFESNNLSGTIPSELGSIQSMTALSLERGNLTQSIPSKLGNLQSLLSLDFDYNQLEGSIPGTLFDNLLSLKELDLNNNRLSGSIPDKIGQLTELNFLQLHTNNFTGTLPESLGNLKSLIVAEFHNNSFTGDMPSIVCENIKPKENIINALTSDCLSIIPVGAEISCSCCTQCYYDA